ncbi:MAG: GNAT family N-acetyltransferase [Pseudomonadota bacterium]
MHVRTSFDIADFAREWPRINDASAAAFHVFQARDYLEEWNRTIGRARAARLCYVRVADDLGPIMLFALAIERRRGVRIASFPDGGVADYNAPILFPRAPMLQPRVVFQLWRKLASLLPSFDAALLDKVPESVDRVSNPLRYLAQDEYEEAGHVLYLDGTWDNFVATRLHRAKDSRRKRRRLAEMGDLRFVIAESAAERVRILDALIAQKTRRYLETRGVDGFDRPGYRTYFHAISERFGPSGEAHLAALELNGEIIAAHWGIVRADRFYCLMLSHGEGPSAQYSPGRLLVEDLIAWCYAQKIPVFDLGVGDGAWKDRFHDTRASLWRAHLPQTLAGKAYIEAARLRRALRAASRNTDRENEASEGRRVA